MIINNEREFIDFYNTLSRFLVRDRRPAYGKFRGFLTYSKSRITQSKNILVELDWRGFNAAEFLCASFGVHSWCYQPRLDKLIGKKYFMAYCDGKKWLEFIERQCVEDQRAISLTSHSQESIKKRLRAEGNLGMCCRRVDLTGGFNLASEICRNCCERGKCANGSAVQFRVSEKDSKIGANR
jgi:hypothetical protein